MRLGLGLGLGHLLKGGSAAPSNTVLPAITGTARVGQTLTCSTGTWTGGGSISYAYQWKAAGVDISGATASTCQLTSAELGKVITCRVTASNAAGSASATSAATAAVEILPIGEYRTRYSSTANQSSYTFTASDIGAADAARLVVVGVAVSATSPGTARAVTSATIGGVAATVHPQSRENNVGNVTFISASVPSGTTGDIVINLSGTALACGVFVWRVVPASSTPIDAISTANTAAASLNDLEIKNGGFLAAIALNSIAIPTITWSGADAITTEFSGSVENARVSAAWANTTENLTTGDIGVSTYAHIAAVSFL